MNQLREGTGMNFRYRLRKHIDAFCRSMDNVKVKELAMSGTYGVRMITNS
jgi:hypothetical protein